MNREMKTILFVLFMAIGFVRGSSSSSGESKYEDTEETEVVPNGLLANINQYFDESLPTIRSSIILNGLDPMELPNLSKDISLRPNKPGVLRGKIDLSKGWLQDLSSIRRSGDLTIQYSRRFLTITINLGWDLLNFNYEYVVKVLGIRRTGELQGFVRDVDINLVILVDTANYEVHLQYLEFTDVGEFVVELQGNPADWIINEVSKLITAIFKEQILVDMEILAAKSIQDSFNKINSLIKPKPKSTDFLAYLNIAMNML